MWFPKHKHATRLLTDDVSFYVEADNRVPTKENRIRLDPEIFEQHFKHGFFIINVFEHNVQFRMLCWRKSRLAAGIICHTNQVTYKNGSPLDLRRANLDGA